MAIRIYSEHGEECEFDEPEFLTGLPGAGSTGVLFAGEGRQLMEMITSFWTALQVWPSQQGILLGVAAVLAILVLMPGRPSAGGILLSIMLAAVIGFLVAYAVG